MDKFFQHGGPLPRKGHFPWTNQPTIVKGHRLRPAQDAAHGHRPITRSWEVAAVEDHLIFGVHIDDRVKHVPDVQRLFTEYGCFIKTRIGLHHVDNNSCSPRGLILLEMYGDPARCAELADRLTAVEGVEVQRMRFTHPD
jgi:hypothetical protein